MLSLLAAIAALTPPNPTPDLPLTVWKPEAIV